MFVTQLCQFFQYIYIYIYTFYCIIKSLIFLLIKMKHLYNPGYMLKLCSILVTVQFAENQNSTWYLQLWTKYFRQILDFMWKSQLREDFNFSFSLIFADINKIFIWKEELAIVYNSTFGIFLVFLKLSGNSCGSVATHIPFLLLTIMLCFTCGKGKIW